ncbi:MAG: DUF397 domain-containing protein [Pseudonocardiales bacterium]|nr:DUF397 domain-containing protein [Actinomycetota bacterium]PZS14740.1 MAG: DUF397 domain-containing protein [Pseudonocardiales bacterium]
MTAPEPDGIVWQKSSYSAVNGDCVEVGWRTSSYSAANGDCVQVAPAPEGVLVRDSKNPEGPALAVPVTAWRALLHTLTP